MNQRTTKVYEGRGIEQAARRGESLSAIDAAAFATLRTIRAGRERRDAEARAKKRRRHKERMAKASRRGNR